MLPYGEPIIPHAKDALFASMCDITQKYSKLPNCSCVLNCCSECPGFFVLDEEMNDEDDVNIPLILFPRYKNISSCSFHKQLFPAHLKHILSV